MTICLVKWGMQSKHQVTLLRRRHKIHHNKKSGKKKDITIMLTVSRDDIKLSRNVFLMLKTMPMEQLPNEIVVKCQNQDDHLQIRLNVIWVGDACCWEKEECLSYKHSKNICYQQWRTIEELICHTRRKVLSTADHSVVIKIDADIASCFNLWRKKNPKKKKPKEKIPCKKPTKPMREPCATLFCHWIKEEEMRQSLKL